MTIFNYIRSIDFSKQSSAIGESIFLDIKAGFV